MLAAENIDLELYSDHFWDSVNLFTLLDDQVLLEAIKYLYNFLVNLLIFSIHNYLAPFVEFDYH